MNHLKLFFAIFFFSSSHCAREKLRRQISDRFITITRAISRFYGDRWVKARPLIKLNRFSTHKSREFKFFYLRLNFFVSKRRVRKKLRFEATLYSFEDSTGAIWSCKFISQVKFLSLSFSSTSQVGARCSRYLIKFSGISYWSRNLLCLLQ